MSLLDVFKRREVSHDNIEHSDTEGATLHDSTNSEDETYGYPYHRPGASGYSRDTFPETYDNTDYKKFLERNELGKVIAEDVAKDCWEKGFVVKNIPEKEQVRIRNTWDKICKTEVARAHTLLRAFGESVLVIGYNDLDFANWDRPVSKNSKISYLLALSPFEFSIVEPISIPKEVTSITVSEVDIHKDRFIYMDEPCLTDRANSVKSVFEPVADVLTEVHDSNWSIGQGLWRAAVGLLSLTGPKGTKEDKARQVIDDFARGHSRTVAYQPPGWAMDVHKLGDKLSAAPRCHRTLVEQVAAGSRIPLSVLLGAPKGAIKSKGEDLSDYYQTISTIQQLFGTPLAWKILNKLKDTGQVSITQENELEPEIEWLRISRQSFAEKVRDLSGEKLARRLVELLEDEQLDRDKVIELLRVFISTGGATVGK